MFKSTKNLTNDGRKVRMALGIILLVVALFELSGALRAIAIVLATYGMITGIVAYCPITELMSGSKRTRHTTHRSSRRHRRR